jgi:hypothetical protein
MHASVASIRFASAASVEFLAGPSGMGTKTMYKIPTAMAPANVVKNAVAILSFMVAPQQRCRPLTLRQFCAFLRACRVVQFFRPNPNRITVSEAETFSCDHSWTRGSLCAAFAIALCIRPKLDPVRSPRAGSFDSTA